MPPGKTTLVGGFMQRITTLALSLAAALAVIPAAHAEAPSSSGVKIGILNDQSGVYADFGGKWSVEAAHMAVDDFGGNVWVSRSRSSAPITRTSRTSPSALPGAGTT